MQRWQWVRGSDEAQPVAGPRAEEDRERSQQTADGQGRCPAEGVADVAASSDGRADAHGKTAG